MSVIMAEELRAGLILGDRDNDQYLYMPGSEIGSDDPVCIFEEHGNKTDLHLAEAVELAKIYGDDKSAGFVNAVLKNIG